MATRMKSACQVKGSVQTDEISCPSLNRTVMVEKAMDFLSGQYSVFESLLFLKIFSLEVTTIAVLVQSASPPNPKSCL